MRILLAVVIATAIICIGASVAGAQVPNVQVYFDPLLQTTQADCGDHFVGHVDSLYVVMNNFNMFVSTVEFSIDIQCAGAPWNRLVYLGDSFYGTNVVGPPPLVLGNSLTGVTATWPLPQNAFNPFICMKIKVLWQCDACPVAPPFDGCPIIVMPHMMTGLLQAIEWQTFRQVQGVGMASLVCPEPISTEETTWGRVKALYTE